MDKVSVKGIWLRTIGKKIQVLVEGDAGWVLLIDEVADISETTISYIAEPLGIASALKDKEALTFGLKGDDV